MTISIHRRVAARGLIGAAAMTMLLGGAMATGTYHEEPGASGEVAGAEATASQLAFHDAMRKLWEDHITWTRLYIVSAATGAEDLPDIGATAERLLANQVDIGDAIKPFYGDEAGDQLTTLLTDHIGIATEVIATAEAGESDALDDALGRWYANGDDIAAFLSDANPDAWPLDLLKGHMRTHLDLTLEEAAARIEGRYEDSIAAYEQVHAQILALADALSEGVISQFPDRFTD